MVTQHLTRAFVRNDWDCYEGYLVRHIPIEKKVSEDQHNGPFSYKFHIHQRICGDLEPIKTRFPFLAVVPCPPSEDDIYDSDFEDGVIEDNVFDRLNYCFLEYQIVL